MITENLSTLKIHKLTQAQYDREKAAGNLDTTALYLTPDESIDISKFVIPADWNQNDETAPDYIKNRPFYTGDPVESVILEETTFSDFSNKQYSIGTGLFTLVEGKTYRVTWDGTDYECVGKNYSGYIMIGNNKIYAYDGTDETDTGEPFAIEIGASDGCIYTTDNNSHTVKIALLEFEIVKIDEKYIPYKPGKAVENVTGAEIFNDYVNNVASGEYAHVQGAYNTASGDYSHAQGFDTDATGYGAHTEGGQTTASSDYAHAQGYKTTASGKYSHAQGYNTTASKEYTHAEGQNTLASSSHQHVQGKNNIEDTSGKYAHIVGNGSSSSARSNAHTVDWDGKGWFKDGVYVGGTGQDDTNAKKLATEEFVNNAVANAGGSDITVDSALSDSSTNPVQNKVVTAKFTELSNRIASSGGSGSGGSSAIIDVGELPSEYINEQSLYRLVTGTFVYNQYPQDDIMTCYCVEEYPEVGEAGTNLAMEYILTYYNITDGTVKAYVDSTLSAALSYPVGWYDVALLFPLADLTYSGIITDISEDPKDSTVRLLLTYEMYSYKGKWSTVGSGAMPKVSSDDNGKILMVVDGRWAATAIENGDEVAY